MVIENLLLPASLCYAGAIRPAGAQQRATLEPNLGFFDGFKSGWVDKSFKVESNGGQPGPSGGTAQCSKIFPGGAVVMGVTDGAFQGRLLLEAWVQTQDGIPDVSVNVAGVKVNWNNLGLLFSIIDPIACT